jgi:hypothetical protein
VGGVTDKCGELDLTGPLAGIFEHDDISVPELQGLSQSVL